MADVKAGDAKDRQLEAKFSVYVARPRIFHSKILQDNSNTDFKLLKPNIS